MIVVLEGVVIMGNERLIRLWKNDKSRREFLENFHDWEVWADVGNLNVTFYRLVLPNGRAIVALEYWQENHSKGTNEPKYNLRVRYYLLPDNYFSPYSDKSVSAIAEYLKGLKEELVKENKNEKICAASQAKAVDIENG